MTKPTYDRETLRGDFGLMTAAEVGVLLGVGQQFLRRWRAKKQGPKFLTINRKPLYRREDVEEWLREEAGRALAEKGAKQAAKTVRDKTLGSHSAVADEPVEEYYVAA